MKRDLDKAPMRIKVLIYIVLILAFIGLAVVGFFKDKTPKPIAPELAFWPPDLVPHPPHPMPEPPTRPEPA